MRDIRITEVQARPVNVPLEHPVRTSVGLIDTAPLVLIDLHTDAGITGRAYLFTYTPLALAATAQMVRDTGRALAGQALAPLELDRLMSGRLRLLGRTGLAAMACAGLDMAAWDAAALARDVPLAVLLGGECRRVPAYDSHAMDGVELGVQRARTAVEQGFRAIKTKIGYATLEQDLQVLAALREAVGPDVAIMADYNQGLTVPEAARRLRALRDLGLEWIEEPTLHDDYAGHARLRASGHVAIQMGENWFGVESMQQALDAGATDLAMPDIMKIGGVTGWLRAAALAQARGLPVSSHIFQEYSAQLLAVTPTAHWLERMDIAAPILAEPLAFADGCAVIPQRPGSGVSWNEDAAARYAAA